MARLPLALPQPTLGDGVVTLRPWRSGDAAALVAAWNDPDIARWSPPPPRHTSVDARRWIAATPNLREGGLALDLVIAAAGSRSVVLGEVGLSGFDDGGSVDIGYWVARAHRHHGVATRAVRLLTSWALGQTGVDSVVATIDQRNPASSAVVRRVGFRSGESLPTRLSKGKNAS